MTKIHYPVALDLVGKAVLLVGGGVVAEGKVDALLESEADVHLVSPDATPKLAALARAGRIRWTARTYESRDIGDSWIVIAAADDRSVNAAVATAARAAGRLVNAVDDVPYCDFIAMSTIRRGDLQIAISTQGGSPAMARWVREGLEVLLPEEYGALLEILAQVRLELKASGAVPPYPMWKQAISDDVLALLTAGRRPEAIARVRTALSASPVHDHGNVDDPVAHRQSVSFTSTPQPAGSVVLVGAGPGDPGLLTLRGRECIAGAEVIVYDQLVDQRLLDIAPPGANRIFAGKVGGGPSVSQDDINSWLIAHARSDKRVVRLKGGDPFIFGRGGEEVLALAEAGVHFEVVPGVSAATAVPAMAGIPITHRELASAVTFVTGHGAGGGDIDFRGLIRSGTTLVILMGLAELERIVEGLREAGQPGSTPVAVIQSGTRSDQRTVAAPLDEIVARVRAAKLVSPALIVVGPAVALRDRILAAAASAAVVPAPASHSPRVRARRGPSHSRSPVK